MRIGELAQSAGVSIQTIRFYERNGLLPVPGRSASGYRCYPANALGQLRNIRALQGVGFTLREIAELVEQERILSSEELAPSLKTSAHRRILERARDRLSKLDQQASSINQMRRELEQLIEAVDNSCPGRGFVLPTEVARLRLCSVQEKKQSGQSQQTSSRRRPGQPEPPQAGQGGDGSAARRDHNITSSARPSFQTRWRSLPSS